MSDETIVFPDRDDTAARIRKVIDECLRRRAAGEALTDEAILAAHPDLAPTLADELRRLQVIADAKEFAKPQRNSEADTRSDHALDTGAGKLEVRCPSCHAPLDVAVDTLLTDLTCGACGSHFSLVDQSKATRSAPPLSKLGRFELVERLGVGGFGSVWKARDKELDRTVAIKIPRAGGMTPDEQEQFFREARAAAQLRHPGIVSVYEIGRDGDSVYIVSDFVRGVTLGDWLTGHKLTCREAAELVAKITDALRHAHDQGIIHRDLKPANIMMDGEGEPHLMDFGLARREIGEITVTMDGHVLGTPAYMSPEQAEGKAHSADRRSDIYSLGVILFQLMTGELPFRGNARMLMHQVIHEQPPSPRSLNSNVPKDLETISLKCMEKRPSDRYATADLLRDELLRFLRGEPIQARPLSLPARLNRWARRKPLVATTYALVLMLAIGGPLTALWINRLRQNVQERLNERDHLMQQNEQEARQAHAEIEKLRSQLNVWEGKANPWDFWPPKPDEPLLQTIANDLYRNADATLARHLADRDFDGSQKARGYLGLAMIADMVGQKSAAVESYQKAIDQLNRLHSELPQDLRFVRALSDCHLAMARLLIDDDRAGAAQHLRSADGLYLQLVAHQHNNPERQLDRLRSSWLMALLNGFAEQGALGEVAKIKATLPSDWSRDPDGVYAFACYLANHDPILVKVSSAENNSK